MSGADINLPAAFEQLVVYKECRHNHAAALGRVSLDGCQEFLKSADEGSKEAMLCIACGCHRNFHRRDTVYNPIISATTQALHEFLNAESGAITAAPSASCVQLVSQRTINVNAAGGGNNPPEEEMLPSRKKRTMFTPEQRSRMIRFAERLGWRAQRAEKEEILQFCLEIGISRRMFLVWLSNKRRRAAQINTTTTTTTTTV